MKKIFFPFFLIILILLLQGCAIKPIFYESEASIPYFDRSTKTVFKLVKDVTATNSFQFGVVSAKDNDTLSYVLLAPTYEGEVAKNLVNVNLNRSIPLLPAQLKEFIKILNTSSEKWNNEFGNIDGISYEFRVAPEYKIIPQSENVVVWYSIFRFYFQNNEKGSLANILFGDGALQYHYTIEKLSMLKDLSFLLSQAIKK